MDNLFTGTDDGELESFETLVKIIARLRGPDGCPWDRKQTHQSIRDSLLEETYEVLSALDNDDAVSLREELGDLLLQIVLHSQIAHDSSEFDISQVIRLINEKLIRRHPHVFGNTRTESVTEVLANWEEIKQSERKERTSMLDGVPAAMPALSYSQAIQKRVARVGFDWEDDSGVVEKVAEEAREIITSASREEEEKEFGDLLFTLANLARRQGIDLESALRGANLRFYHRFSTMEKLCFERGLKIKDLCFEEQNKLWEEAKRLEV
ncbi:MAG: nucleoside triphosphate pyrophosphohydrolase [Dehalococcoidales bacterium]|jgi:tetrapyrrole methylase family protein/MazG family protein|nr:nucleoside triphosphate pyrophosphohydrolase [Dehalococcoidales bacterium]MDD3264429.1 nucleoside triphosphate pyrophosphohydrolase [Dehalococcoidales bacterium]MDD4321969.1 nucleoside triphosphate pyrophosphohydrolase [Dehalococcoidales bacterium]MDD4794055.1 nucleoside triphosphate pyrophosphohydrolase [Dehalococcoidales bacterium]MDD5122248.1 nucleoside triphosphate pyrophosphohydrolase [Dehalococcoidales bacterium]